MFSLFSSILVILVDALSLHVNLRTNGLPVDTSLTFSDDLISGSVSTTNIIKGFPNVHSSALIFSSNTARSKKSADESGTAKRILNGGIFREAILQEQSSKGIKPDVPAHSERILEPLFRTKRESDVEDNDDLPSWDAPKYRLAIFADGIIEFYFENPLGQRVPVQDLITDDLLTRLGKHVPDLGLVEVSGEKNLAIKQHYEPFWTKTFFPYTVAGVSVVIVLTVVLIVYLCCCRDGKKKEFSDEEIVVGHSIYYPALKPELTIPTPVQPDSPVPIFTAAGVSTPVPAQPVRIKAKGLLERRGSNASLTLDLNPTSDLGRWEGTPPKESTALEYLMSAGNRLSRRDLRNAVKYTKILYEEFWEIPMNHTEKVSVAGSGTKNRYKTIIPNEHSRVLLPDIDNDPLNSYINANYIRKYHFCVYFMNHVLTVHFDKFQYNGESQTVLHYWYTAWPDHKPPDSPHMLLDLVKEVELRRYQPNDLAPRGPVCVHCSAGIGRTGCFIAISIGIRQLREEHSVDALGIVCAMRIDRGGMIQTHEQYDFVHQALAAYERELGEPSVQSITALTTECVTTP
uniref:protein-tyrosine-phosphatase n=1 Tax=Biomphalaria glabrata TaxID=6526 RepID=A0A2C9LCS8_BIOGL